MISVREMSLCRYSIYTQYPCNKLHCCTFTATYWGLPNWQHAASVIGSRPSDHYFHSVCWFVCLCRVFSAVFDPIL